MSSNEDFLVLEVLQKRAAIHDGWVSAFGAKAGLTDLNSHHLVQYLARGRNRRRTSGWLNTHFQHRDWYRKWKHTLPL